MPARVPRPPVNVQVSNPAGNTTNVPVVAAPTQTSSRVPRPNGTVNPAPSSGERTSPVTREVPRPTQQVYRPDSVQRSSSPVTIIRDDRPVSHAPQAHSAPQSSPVRTSPSVS